MNKTYKITSNGLEKTDAQDSILRIYRDPSDDERIDFIQELDLPEDVFDFDDIPHVAPRIESLYNENLGDTLIFVFSNIIDVDDNTSVEKRLESHTFILGQEVLFWFMNDKDSTLDEEFLKKKGSQTDSLQSILLNAGLISYTNFTDELHKQKRVIDELNERAINTTSRDVLIDVSDTERNMVMLQHTIDTQEKAFTKLLEDEEFVEKLGHPFLVHDIKWYNRQVKKLVHVYRDLLDTASSLFSDIMSNNLNKLMKFLSSLSLVLAATSLIGELWRMNTGGMPFEESGYGSWLMMGIALLAGIGMYLFLKNKEYFDD